MPTVQLPSPPHPWKAFSQQVLGVSVTGVGQRCDCMMGLSSTGRRATTGWGGVAEGVGGRAQHLFWEDWQVPGG